MATGVVKAMKQLIRKIIELGD